MVQFLQGLFISHALKAQYQKLQVNMVKNNKIITYGTTILIVIVASLNDIVTSVATTVLPDSWKDHLWLSWLLVVLMTAISIWLAFGQLKLENGDKQSVAQTLADFARQQLLNKMRNKWIISTLDKSLLHGEMLPLALEKRPAAIRSRFDEAVQRPLQPQPLPSGTKIIDILDQATNSLLILGEPGAGKTIMLYKLMGELLDRAKQDEKHLIPVFFHLSLWAKKRRPLAEWLVEVLYQFYGIDSQTAQIWISEQRILLLLDGLDEVAATYQIECVEAINKFHRSYNLVGLVVCSRFNDYERIATKLELQEAILVKPLTEQQVDTHLKKLGNCTRGVYNGPQKLDHMLRY